MTCNNLLRFTSPTSPSWTASTRRSVSVLAAPSSPLGATAFRPSPPAWRFSLRHASSPATPMCCSWAAVASSRPALWWTSHAVSFVSVRSPPREHEQPLLVRYQARNRATEHVLLGREELPCRLLPRLTRRLPGRPKARHRVDCCCLSTLLWPSRRPRCVRSTQPIRANFPRARQRMPTPLPRLAVRQLLRRRAVAQAAHAAADFAAAPQSEL